MTTERDLRIDGLRGFALCLITLAHLNFDWLMWSWDSAGHASAAELFVFMSGLVSGIVYWKMAGHTSEREIRARAFARARLIYFSYVGLVVYIAAYIHAVHSLGIDFLAWGCQLLLEDPALSFALAPLFIYQPGYSNILPMYCVFMLLVPVAIRQLRLGRDWLVLGASVGLWIAAQQGAFRAWMFPLVRHFEIRPIYFDPFAWQLLFVVGLWFGARRAAGQPVRLPKSKLFAWALVPPLLVSFAIRHQIFFDDSVAAAAKAVTRRHDLDVLRLLNFAALAYLVARLSEWRRSWFEWRWLAYLGQHSLQVFTFSVAAVYFAQLIARDVGPAGQLVAVVLVLGSLMLPAWAHVRYRERRARRTEARA